MTGLLLVPTSLCGATLPLLFHLAKEQKETLGERVGEIYAVNTLGCVAGAVFGGYLGFYFFDLEGLFRGALLLSLISFFLAFLWVQRTKSSPWGIGLGNAFLALLIIGIFKAPPLHRERFLQAFRQQRPMASSYSGAEAFGKFLGGSSRLLFQKDGPDLSVFVGAALSHEVEQSRTLYVNGKSDGNTKGDYLTMSLTAHLPGLFARKLDEICLIGLGTGITAGAFARYGESGTIDVIEISDTVIQASKFFDSYNGGVSSHPKIRFHALDAFRFLGGTQKKFDVIVSEPSNPWVVGVENLYSREFYKRIQTRLQPGGLFVQWIQTYSFNDELLRKVIKTITTSFKHVSVFQMMENDLALVASEEALNREDLERAYLRWKNTPSIQDSLAYSGIKNFETVLALELVPESATSFLAEGAQEQTLESPRLGYQAAKTFFEGSSAHINGLRRSVKEFFPSVKRSLLATYLDQKLPSRGVLDSFRATFCDEPSARNSFLCEETILMTKWLSPGIPIESLYPNVVGLEDLKQAALMRNRLPENQAPTFYMERSQLQFDLYKRYFSPVARIPIEPALESADFCLRKSPPESETYGQCLLQKAAILEVANPGNELLQAIQAYGRWFPNLSAHTTNYSQYENAAHYMESLARKLKLSQDRIPGSLRGSP